MRTIHSLLFALTLSACSCGDDDGSGSKQTDPTAGDDASDGGSDNGAGQGSEAGRGGTLGGGAGTGGDAQGAGGRGALDGIVDDSWTIPDALLLCGERACVCADGMDNDGDGVADGFDLECQGPNDDDEGSFATGISGDNQDPKWQDCFFDGNSGAGDDDCRYHVDCLTGDKASDDPDCVVSDACIEFCVQRTPNGCDCFGCCTLQRDGEQISVVVSETCDEGDLEACTSCTPSAQCENACGDCELCPGRTAADLPDQCFEDGSGGEAGSGGESGGDGPPVQCDSGQSVCSTTADCPAGMYCAYACCTVVAPD